MPSPRPAALLLLPLLAWLAACPGREDGPSSEGPRLPELALPEARVGSPYEASLAASGGSAPLRYALEGLAPGLTYEIGTGELRGSATQGGDYEVRAKVVDARGLQDLRVYALHVIPSLDVTTRALPPAQVGAAYSARLEVAALSLPVQWTLVGGALPAGLTLAADGTLYGTPSSVGTASFTVQARDARGTVGERALLLDVRSAGSGAAVALEVANWNLEWFGDANNGPGDDALQLQNAVKVMRSVDADVWALQEIVDVADFEALKAQLPGYDGFVASDALLEGSDEQEYSADEQKLAVLFRSERVQLVRALLVRRDRASLWAGRPPLRVDLRVSDGGATTELTVIVVHLKAFAGTTEWAMRRDEALVLKEYLDLNLPLQRVLVLGDWNDDLDVSIAKPNPTPFQSFLDDPADYTFVTQPLTTGGQSTTVGYSDPIDHQLATNELRADYVAGSLAVFKPTTAFIPSYGDTTSDHYPVSSRYAFPVP